MGSWVGMGMVNGDWVDGWWISGQVDILVVGEKMGGGQMARRTMDQPSLGQEHN